MKTSSTLEKHIFGESRCGQIAQARDWSKSAVGPAESWPQSLRTSLSIVMRSQFPMFVAWGPSRTFFYNDAYAGILGKKHPDAFGRGFADIWSEIWDDIEPLILKVENGEAIYQENLKLIMNRYGYDEETYFTFSYSPIVDDGSAYEGLFCAVFETTRQIHAEHTERQLRERAEVERRKFESIFAESASVMALVKGPNFIFEKTNTAYQALIGNRQVVGKPFAEALPELKDHPFLSELQKVYATGVTFFAKESLSRIQRTPDGPSNDVYMDFTYQRIDNPGGEAYILGTAVDVTEKVQAREAMRNEFQWLQLVLNKVEAAILLVDPTTGDLIFTNEAAERMAGGLTKNINDYGEGYDFSDQRGRVIPKRDWPRSRASRGEILSGEKFVWKTPHGTWEYLVYADQIPESLGRASAVLICMLDITELRRAEKKLEQSEAELRTLANAIPQLAWMAHADGRIFWFNERWYDYTGTTYEEMKDWGWRSIHDPLILPTVMKGWMQAILNGENFEMTFPLKGADGSFRWFLTRAQALRDENGTIVRWFGTNTDVQEDREIAIDLKLKSDALENSLNGFDIVNDKGALIYVNQAYLRMWGFDSPDEVLGKSPSDHCADPDVPRRIISELKSRGQCDIEFVAKRKDGSTFDVRMLAFLTYDSAGREIYPTTSIDITDQRRSAETLTRAKEQAERANQLKSAFLANMSHEIRTPLGVMVGFADLISDPEISDEERRQYAETLKRNGEQLTDIVNDILDLSKVEAGYLAIELKPVRLQEVVDAVIPGMEVKARQKGIRLLVDESPALKRVISCDPMRLKQILFNLLGNAVKFTFAGQVLLRATESKDEDVLEIEVQDTGIGIAEKDQAKLFKPFSQADDSMTRKFGGTGLGLALSKRLAALMGGDLTIKESVVGAGSTFSLKMRKASLLNAQYPGLRPSPSTYDLTRMGDLEGKSVLVVDDSPDNKLLVARFLTKEKAKVDFADNGLEAMTKALQGSYDIVIMDIQMPVMDGYTATQKLRELGYQRPIIALTAHALNDIRQKCLDVGYNDYAPKPINLQELYHKVLGLLS